MADADASQEPARAFARRSQQTFAHRCAAVALREFPGRGRQSPGFRHIQQVLLIACHGKSCGVAGNAACIPQLFYPAEQNVALLDWLPMSLLHCFEVMGVGTRLRRSSRWHRMLSSPH
jgi:hypothetical protein